MIVRTAKSDNNKVIGRGNPGIPMRSANRPRLEGAASERSRSSTTAWLITLGSIGDSLIESAGSGDD